MTEARTTRTFFDYRTSMREFDEVMARAREAARRAGMKPSDVASAIAAVRSR